MFADLRMTERTMTTRTRVRRLLGGLAGAAGLAYPACAAVCPRGIGGCQFPGRCFLFTDVDANALCDYTGRSFSGTTSTAAPVATATPVPISSGTAPAATTATTTCLAS